MTKEEFEKKYHSMTTGALAKEMGVSRATIVNIAKREGIKVKSRGWGPSQRKIKLED